MYLIIFTIFTKKLHMKKTILQLALLISMLAFINVNAQRQCATHEHHLSMMATDPNYKANREKIEIETAQYVANPLKQTRIVKTIPVVFHIVYNNATQNVSDAQIMSQLDVLNKDFRKLNTDWANTPAVFQPLVADCEIQFCLAQQDPAGNATTGINRVATNVTSFSTNNAVKYSAQGGANIWDRNKYLNIWVCNLSGGVLGYAQFPGGAAATDGVVITYTGFGTIGTAQAPFNKGRTATHEVGHWLNLYHIWGDDGTACNGSDQVNDTPNQGGPNYGCPAFPKISCNNGPNGDMHMNYMDYSDDACMYMFSNGQKVRIDALFAAGGARASLLNSPGCNPPAAAVCNAPTGLNATNVTTTTATLNWGAVNGALNYTLQYKQSNAASWITVTSNTNTYSLSGLIANTAYQFQVSSNCSAGISPYSSIATFTTLQNAATCTNSYESNNTINTAAVIPINTNILSIIGSNTDKDWYRITTTNAAPKLRVTLNTLPADYDIRLYNANGTQLAISQNASTNPELIKYNTPTTGATYYIQVYGYNGAFNANQCYTLNASTSANNWRLMPEDENQIAEKNAINIYPNPSDSKINAIFFAEENLQYQVNIYNALGQKIIAENGHTHDGENRMAFDMTKYASGIYIMELVMGEERKIQRFSIQK